MVGSAWIVLSDVTWKVCYTDSNSVNTQCTYPNGASRSQPLLYAKFDLARNWWPVFHDMIMPIFCCGALAYTTLLFPVGLAMPRVGITLLALVAAMGANQQ